jgi:hypothetical protein
MAIFLMIFGTFYMAMPLTAAATTFYTVHEKYANKPEYVPGKGMVQSSITSLDAGSGMVLTTHEHVGYNRHSLVANGEGKTASDSEENPLPHNSTNQQLLSANNIALKKSLMSENMKAMIQSAIKEFRSYDRLLEEVITDLHSSPIIIFDEAMMIKEELNAGSRKSSTFSLESDLSTRSLKGGVAAGNVNDGSWSHEMVRESRGNSFEDPSLQENPLKRLSKMRKNIAKLCKGLEDTLRINEQVVVDVLYLQFTLLHGDTQSADSVTDKHMLNNS